MKDFLSESLGVEYVPAVVETKKEIVVEEENPVKESSNTGMPPFPDDISEDYKLARKTFRDLIKKGTTAIDRLEQVSKEAETAREAARIAEVMSAFMKTVSDTTKDMFSLQKATKELIESPSDKKQETTVNVDKAVFVGTSSELLKKIKEE